jgi:hypothetical protein
MDAIAGRPPGGRPLRQRRERVLIWATAAPEGQSQMLHFMEGRPLCRPIFLLC